MSLFPRAKAEVCHLNATVRAEGSLTSSRDLDIEGTIHGGPVESKGHIIIHARAEVHGDLKSHSLLIEPGGRYRGKVAVGAVPSDILRRFGKILGLIK